AEDGIRDFHVTGVQTCALPICEWRLTALEPGPQRVAGQQALGSAPGLGATTGAVPATDANLLLLGSLGRLQVMQLELFSFFGHRSEERRVGKECRCLWSRSS